MQLRACRYFAVDEMVESLALRCLVLQSPDGSLPAQLAFGPPLIAAWKELSRAAVSSDMNSDESKLDRIRRCACNCENSHNRSRNLQHCQASEATDHNRVDHALPEHRRGVRS